MEDDCDEIFHAETCLRNAFHHQQNFLINLNFRFLFHKKDFPRYLLDVSKYYHPRI